MAEPEAISQGLGGDLQPEEISRISRFFPVLDSLSAYLKKKGCLSGTVIGWHCHLTWLTALAVEPVLEAGGQLRISECSADTTQPAAVDYMRSLGVEVYCGSNSCAAVLSSRPQIISDTGLVLISEYLANPDFPLFAACEITTSGITRLRDLSSLPLPVVNINDGQLKRLIENFHGVGQGLIEALERLTGRIWSGRPVAVVGYGQVGAGAAHYLKQAGASVAVVEKDPVRRLVAHYDGYLISDMASALSTSELVVTATGVPGLIGAREWSLCRDGLVLVNVGHWSREIDLPAVRAMAVSSQAVSDRLSAFELPGSRGLRTVYLAAGGSPVNVTLLSGSPEPTLIHLTTEILCLDYLCRLQRAGQSLPCGETPVPTVVERQASILALEALALQQEVKVASTFES